MKIVASNSLTLSNVNDGTITHTAYSYSADGADRFSTVYPNLNLLDGTKNFSGTWSNIVNWVTDGTYNGLTVKKRTAGLWSGIYKTFTVPKDGNYTFSAYIKSSGNTANIFKYGGVNSKSANVVQRQMGNNFGWIRDSVTLNLKANDNVWVKYEISGSGTDSILWNAGHKWEEGSIATPYMQSASEVTTADYPRYIGQYTDFTQADSTNPSDYTWSLIRGNDGKDGKDGIAGKDGVGIKTTVITYAISTSGTTAPTTGWTSSVPSLVKGQYLWTKTVWTYTDSSSKTGYSVTYIAKDGNNGQDPIVITLTKPLLIIQANAEGVIDATTGYNNTDSIFSLNQSGNNLLPVQAPKDGIYANGSYSLSYTTQDISLTTTNIDTVSMSIKIGKLQQMSSDASSASINYLATGKDYYGNSFTKNIIQIITKSLNSYGGRIFIMYAPTNDLTLEDISVNPQYNSLYIGTAVGSSLYSPTKKAQYIWTEYATDNIVYSPTVPVNPLNGERWINNDPNSPNYNQQMVYNGTTQTWVLDMLSANNIFSNRIYSEGGDFKWIKSDNYSETNHIGTFINLETGEIELGSSGFDKNGNPIQTSDTSLNRYLSWKDLGGGNKALVIGDITSGSSLQLTPDRMSFYNGDTEVMYITNQILRINQAILLQGLYIGEHKMESRGKHTVFVFTGGV